MAERARVGFETVFVSKTPPEDDRTNRLIDWGKRLHRLGLISGSAGNLSFRTQDGFVVTGTGFSLATLTKGELVEVVPEKMENGQILVFVRGKVIPSKETLCHRVIYQLRVEIKAVFHVHDQLVLEFAEALGVPSTEREQPGGSSEQAQEVEKLLNRLPGVPYFVLRNHGVMALGETLEEAGRLVAGMNKRARQAKSQG